MEIIQNDPKYRQRFIELNTAWIENYFVFLEKEDIKTFQEIDREICKLAADEHGRGKGAGSRVFEKCMEYAVLKKAKRLFILSSSTLKPALHICQKYGFEEIKLDNYQYIRGDIAFEYIVKP